MTSNSENTTPDQSFSVLNWQVEPRTNRITQETDSRTLEPKVMDLLVVLAQKAGQVVSKDALTQTLWPDTIVGEDTLARTVSKLRRALGDDTQQPRYIETIPKRGYRLIAPVLFDPAPSRKHIPSKRPYLPLMLTAAGLSALLVLMLGIVFFKWPSAESPVSSTAQTSQAAQLTERGTDLYMRFTRADNEAAIVLFERAMTLDPAYAPAQAGLANALVQRVIRWQSPAGNAPSATSLNQALAEGLTQTAPSPAILSRAVDLGQRAVRLSPRNPDAHKALGFAYSAQGQLEDAKQSYQSAIALDPKAWEAMTNMGELASIEGNPTQALNWYERAYSVMDNIYTDEPQRVGPWRAPLGVLIGDNYKEQGDKASAELWYRRVLDQTPLEPEATSRLAQLLYEQGDHAQARRLCQALMARIGTYESCRIDG